MRTDDPAYFDEHTEPEPNTGCWLWIGAIQTRQPHWRAATSGGYGVFRSRPRYYAHQESYRRFIGPIPEGLEIDHRCRQPRCVNPAHLEAVTHAENMRRGGQAIKTHCKHGHPFTPENTAYHRTHQGRPVAYRYCRRCQANKAAGREVAA